MRSAFLAAIFLASALAHTWLDCADWRFNNPATDPTKTGWKDGQGTCNGYARRFPRARKEFGTHDSYIWFRHYLQAKPFDTAAANRAAPCNPFTTLGQDGVTKVGGDERRGNPLSAAYTPNKDPDGFEFGTMTRVQAGQQLCFRWPAKNHAGHVNDQNMVMVNWATTPNTEPTQAELNTMTVAQLRFRNCPEPGVPSSGDQTGAGSDRMACGGCFTVPNRAPGNYLVQWRWMLNAGEWYTSCADVEVVASATPTSAAVATSAAVPATSAATSAALPATSAATSAPRPATTGAANQAGVNVKAYVTISLPGAPDSFDVSAFIANLAKVLNIPTAAIIEVGVKLDKSSSLVTVLEVVIGNVNGVDPVKAAQRLKQLAETRDQVLAQNDLAGMTVEVAEVSSATVAATSALLLLFALALLF